MAKTGNSELREWFNFIVYFHYVQPFRHEGSVFSGKDFTKISLTQLLGEARELEVSQTWILTVRPRTKQVFKWPANLGLQKHRLMNGAYGASVNGRNEGVTEIMIPIRSPLMEAVGCRSCNNHHLKDSEKMVFNSVVPLRHLWDVKLVEVDVNQFDLSKIPPKILMFSVLCEMRRDASFKIWCHVIHVSKKHLHTQRWDPIEL